MEFYAYSAVKLLTFYASSTENQLEWNVGKFPAKIIGKAKTQNKRELKDDKMDSEKRDCRMPKVNHTVKRS